MSRVIFLSPGEAIYTTELGLGDDGTKMPYWVDGPTFAAREDEIPAFAAAITSARYPDGNEGGVIVVHVYRSRSVNIADRVFELARPEPVADALPAIPAFGFSRYRAGGTGGRR